ncbi:membrane-bound O-acyltransferase family protein [Siphonobacter sp. BAB-5405]|uniref:MBOAT family O-acyltransferase n=2 Tax=unclassified Siphonobacter TaxID=2635712 RepID=UPI000C804233|nr:MBOAT family protein [Siphonobacter sp. BAB-5405]PMD98828.1 membrane-bound O-acyltransferase family protein [Siphonobacter sp. BAB-5405]
MPPIDFSKLTELLQYQPEAPILFNSGLFLWLFLGFSSIYVLLQPNHRGKVIFVTLFSLYFYYKSSGWYFLLLVLATVVDYVLGWFIYDADQKIFKRLWMVLNLILNLGLLAYFKYTNFFYQAWTEFSHQPYNPLPIFLPVGVSFYTFQSLSYTIDIYRGEIKPVKSILDYAFFVSFFPQLVAGPIVRAKDFIPQLYRPTVVTPEQFGRAVFLIGSGLFKKVIISDYISINFVDRIFDNPTLYSGLENLFGVYGYALQIYCDFSGYSDMAIGIALLLGFEYPVNFDSPYQSRNITEFWRRWHISLSSWLRDYLYISMGGNRKGIFRTYFNLFMTMVLGGLWHGAAWRFMLWGGLHGGALVIHRFIRSFFSPGAYPMYRWLAQLLTFHFVCFCWIFFRADSMEIAQQLLHQIATQFDPTLIVQFVEGYQNVLLVMLLGYTLHFMPRSLELQAENWITRLPLVGKLAWLLAVILLMTQVQSAEVQPFIYFQF